MQSTLILLFFDIRHAVSGYKFISVALKQTGFSQSANTHQLGGEFADSTAEVTVKGLIPQDAECEEILNMFGEIRSFKFDGLYNSYHVEFYDSRSASKAFQTLNGANIKGRHIHVSFKPVESYAQPQTALKSPPASIGQSSFFQSASSFTECHYQKTENPRSPTLIQVRHLLHEPHAYHARASSASIRSFQDDLDDMADRFAKIDSPIQKKRAADSAYLRHLATTDTGSPLQLWSPLSSPQQFQNATSSPLKKGHYQRLAQQLQTASLESSPRRSDMSYFFANTMNSTSYESGSTSPFRGPQSPVRRLSSPPLECAASPASSVSAFNFEKYDDAVDDSDHRQNKIPTPDPSPVQKPKSMMMKPPRIITKKLRSPSLLSEMCVNSAPVMPTGTSAVPRENEVDLNLIITGKEKRTSIMLKNVPNRYTQEMLIQFVNETHEGLMDFFYLRCDFLNKCNVGYAFINFISPIHIVSFVKRMEGQKWPKFNSEKVPLICFANIQGKDAFIDKFRNSSVMLEEPNFRPKLFYSTGPLQGQEEPFPPPTSQIRPRSNILFSRDGVWPANHPRNSSPTTQTPI
ncbi:hypothetical protein HDV05_006453 [Chytridiales sp. JEL 0842]|nr:hypothetical protein HDV05_006453 [Chytridiales sp. JEL 0842]